MKPRKAPLEDCSPENNEENKHAPVPFSQSSRYWRMLRISEIDIMSTIHPLKQVKEISELQFIVSEILVDVDAVVRSLRLPNTLSRKS